MDHKGENPWFHANNSITYLQLKPARKHLCQVLKRLDLARSGSKRTAHLRHTFLCSIFPLGEGFTKRTVHDLKGGDPNARIVTLPGASTYILLSNENDTVREMRSIVGGLALSDLSSAKARRRFGNLIGLLNRPDS